MPRACIDTADATELTELTETLQLIAGWLAADPATLAPFAPGLHRPPRLRLDALRNDLDRFTFLIGGSEGEFLLGEDPA